MRSWHLDPDPKIIAQSGSLPIYQLDLNPRITTKKILAGSGWISIPTIISAGSESILKYQLDIILRIRINAKLLDPDTITLLAGSDYQQSLQLCQDPSQSIKSWSKSKLLLNWDPSPYFIWIQILGILPKNPSWIRMDLDTYHNLIRICIHPKISAWSNPQNPNQYQISGSGSSQKSYRNTESGYQILIRIKFPAGSYLKS